MDIPVKPGEEFTYLGVRMICIANTQNYVEFVVAHYFNTAGELQTQALPPNSYPGIIPISSIDHV